MGTASSRRPSTDSVVEPEPDAAAAAAAGWPVEYSEAVASWRYTAVLWGFDPLIDYTSNVKTRLQSSCVGGRHFHVRYVMPAETTLATVDRRRHLLVTLTDGCFKLETHLRLPVDAALRLHAESGPPGQYLKPIQVIGHRDGIAVLQLNGADSTMQFVVVHMSSSTVLGRLTEQTLHRRHYLCDCFISPDLSRFLLKPNAMYVLNFCPEAYDDALKLVSFEHRHRPVVRRLFVGAAVRQVVAFDPRYRHRRIAVGNQLRAGADVVRLYDTPTERVVAESDASHGQTTHNLTFSPDGVYLASLVLGRSLKDGLFNFPAVLIYSTDDLHVLRSLATHSLSEVPTLSPAALFPLFSETGSHLAVAHGRQGTFYQQVAGVTVHRVPLRLNLQSLCRLAIRRHYDGQDVDRLPLPRKLRDFLHFQPFYA